MAKRWRDEIAVSKPSSKLRRRKGSESGGVGTLDRDDTTKRRRIAGERSVPASESPSDKSADDATSKGDGPDSKTLAQELNTKPSLRKRLAGPAWATLTGLVVGGVLTGLVYAGMQTFQAIYNTPAGHGVGAGVLVAVLVIAMLVGRFLLKWRNLHDPNATTLLAVLLMVIVTLGVLLPVVFSSWMLLITPLLGAATYLLSHLLVAHFGQAPHAS